MCVRAAALLSFPAATAIAPGFVAGVDRVGFIVYKRGMGGIISRCFTVS